MSPDTAAAAEDDSHQCFSLASSVIAVPILVVNFLFCLFTALVGILFSADLLISFLYQFAMPTSAATAVGSLLLLFTMSKWIVVFVAVLADWTRWPIYYPRLKSLVGRLLRRLPCRVCKDNDTETIAAPDLRDLLRHLALFFIWLLSLLVSIGNELVGTWLFVLLTLTFTLANTSVNVRELRLRPLSRSPLPYIIYSHTAVEVTLAALVLATGALTSVVARGEWSLVGSGTSAVAVAYAFTTLTIAGLAYLRWSPRVPYGLFKWHTIDIHTSRGPKILLVADTVCLFIASCILFATTGPESGGVIVFLMVLVCGLVQAPAIFARNHHFFLLPENGDLSNVGVIEIARVRKNSSPTGSSHHTDNVQGDVLTSLVPTDVSETTALTVDTTTSSTNPQSTPVDRKVAVRRLAVSLFVFLCVFVFCLSLVDSSSDPLPRSCPGSKPGRSANQGRYELCAVVYPPSNLTTVDFIALTSMSYMRYNNKIRALSVFFPNRDVIIDDELSSYDSGSALTSFVGVNFTVIRFTSENATIVSVRGSFRSIDWLQDLYIMSDSLAIQLGKAVLPLPLNDGVAESLVAFGGSFKFGMQSYTSKIDNVIEIARQRYPDDTIFITGHSLGGFTANVVAAKQSVRSVTMSPIGTGLTAKRYAFDRALADQFVLSLLPDGDIVPKIDEQLGFTQHFVSQSPCVPSNAFCHALYETFDSIADNCGDPLGRSISFGSSNAPCS